MANGFNPNTWPTFQQSMPMAQGAMTGEALLRAHLQNQMQKQQNEARPGMDAAKLAQILQQNEAQPGLDAAKLSQMQATTQGQQITNVQAPEMLELRKHLADIAMQNASARQQQIGVQKDKMSTYQMRALTAAMNTPQGRAQLAQNPDMLKNLLSTQGAYTQKVGQSINAPTIGGFTKQGQQPEPIGFGGAPQPAISQQQPQPSQQSIGSIMQQSMQQPAQTQPQPSQQATDQQVAAIQDLLASKNIKDTVPAAIQQQRYYANTMNQIGDRISQQMPSISQYFGASGRAKLAKDKISAATGTVTPEYQEYYNFMTNEMPMYANEMKRAIGGQATDEENKLMKNMVNPNWWLSNPEMGIKRFKDLQRTEKLISGSVSGTQAQIQKQNLAASQAQPSRPTPPVVSAAPAGTVNMINPKDGQVYHVKEDQVEDAIASASWRRA